VRRRMTSFQLHLIARSRDANGSYVDGHNIQRAK
jgi:hypothetical protein